MKIRLNHWCNLPGCHGAPGQIIDVTDARAALLIERGGAVALPSVPDTTPAPDRDAEKAPAERPVETAARRTARPAGRDERKNKGETHVAD